MRTLQERLTVSGYITDGAGRYEKFWAVTGTTIRVTLYPDGTARVSGFDCQMSWRWSIEIVAQVDDALIIRLLDAWGSVSAAAKPPPL
jgi:hypothetical protein